MSLADSMTRSRLMDGSRRVMFSITEPVKRNTSCSTMAMRLRRAVSS